MGSDSPSPAPRASSDPYYDLGYFSIKVTTKSSEAQIWFNRAVLWTYCFNHDEAIFCYEQAIAHDDDLALAYWGISFCSGPNYNKTWRLFDEKDRLNAINRCYTFSQQALQRVGNVAPWERALIKALDFRYPDNNRNRDLAACDRAYADAMRDVHRQFGEGNFDIITLFADALMNIAPRKMFNTANGQPIPTTPVFEVKDLLEAALQMPGVEKHPGVAHMYIHLMEMSATPEAALPAADMIRDQVPDTGHTYHMPAHIDVLVGDYRRAVEYNLKATIADDKYFQRNGGLTFYSYYRLHDYHSLIYAAMLGGKSKAALNATDRMEATITEKLLRTGTPALANWMEFFLAVRVHVYIRFGMWTELKELKPKQDKHLYCVTNVFGHYGKAIAHAATNELDQANVEYKLFKQASLLVPPTRLDFPNKIIDILRVATAMLDGEIEYRRGNYKIAFNRLRDAIELEDDLPFAEPWGWMLPARHPYAALSLEQGYVEEAAIAYAEDLGLRPTPKRWHQHPNNIWALHGYHECLVRLERDAEANIIRRQLTLAAAEADVKITSSCFCRFKELAPQVDENHGCCSGNRMEEMSRHQCTSDSCEKIGTLIKIIHSA
ncbi:hypothetical protein LCI18_013721 [Fusarium solani-melongenae]|uniref:Uncharacterized protein n=1 Tax=Fusarium solani subsp. cucurbitae TaxID=2747967 RepID=A0ACD3ZPL9_FUSSC|nr:hypothetical protein LCI18_013721 [Fusarium solani-melongenae]